MSRQLIEIIDALHEPHGDPLPAWRALIAALRPKRANRIAEAETRLATLCELLEQDPARAAALREALARLLRERPMVSLLTTSGLLPSTGFFSEASRRLSGKLLPDLRDTAQLKGVFALLFERDDDHVWVEGIADASWLRLLAVLMPDPSAQADSPPPTAVMQLLEALRILSYQISAIGIDRELLRIDPQLERHESPFLAQNEELLAYLRRYLEHWQTHDSGLEDEKQLEVLLDQCRAIIERLRRRSASLGTSLSLTFKLERLRQHLDRCNQLLELLARLRNPQAATEIPPRLVALFKELVRGECRQHRLSDHWRTNIELLSLRITENVGQRGEHYITNNRREYFGMLRSAAGAGVIIALMAAIKLQIGKHDFAPLNAALLACLNYGLGFVLIHILGFTVATKQPAMTANALAASIGEASGKQRDLSRLVELIARTCRSQLAAILGNVCLAIPVAAGVGVLIHQLSGAHYVSPDKAQQLFAEVHPLTSGAPVFAAIAGVCLFLSGLIAGYYDNLAAYNRIPDRLRQLGWLRRLFGATRTERIADYVQHNLGALAGNFFFGFLLGGVTALGMLFGLPLDIRHIAFSSAYIGYGVTALDFQIDQTVAIAMLGVAIIGLVNLAVSFSLALLVALRARRITFAQGSALMRQIMVAFLRRPQDFLLPPSRQSDAPPEATPTQFGGRSDKG